MLIRSVLACLQRAVRMMAGRMDDLDESQAFREGFTAMSAVSTDQEAGSVLNWYREKGYGKEGGGPSGVSGFGVLFWAGER